MITLKNIHQHAIQQWRAGQTDSVKITLESNRQAHLTMLTGLLNEDSAKDTALGLKSEDGNVNFKTEMVLEKAWSYMSADRLLRNEVAQREAQVVSTSTPGVDSVKYPPF